MFYRSRSTALTRSTASADDQLAVQFLIKLLLPALPCRYCIRLRDVGLVRLSMTDRSKPRQVSSQHRGRMICDYVFRQIGKDADSIPLMGGMCR